MLSAITIDIKKFIYKLCAGLSKDYASYISRYTQTHNAFDKNNNAAYIFDDAIQRFLNTCDDPSSLKRETLLSLHILPSKKPSKSPAIKCIHCGKCQHKENKCWSKHPHFKLDYLFKTL